MSEFRITAKASGIEDARRDLLAIQRRVKDRPKLHTIAGQYMVGTATP